MLSPSHPLRFFVSYNIRRLHRMGRDAAQGITFAMKLQQENFHHIVIEHRSPILRKLAGIDPQLQINKKTNLQIVEPYVDGIIIQPDEVFSFWKACGAPKESRGFLPGLVIQSGNPGVGIGGGLCQLSNALFWCFLHSDLEVIERHRHSFDLFPDDNRQVPFGLGAGVAYGVKDLRSINKTAMAYQIRMKVTDYDLQVRLLADHPPKAQYRVFEADSQYYRKQVDGELRVFRKNKVMRENLKTGDAPEHVLTNDFECRYEVEPHLVRSDC